MEPNRPRHARQLLGLALTAGIAGDTLLRAAPWGVNFSFWGILLLAIVAAASRLTGEPLPGEAWMLATLGGICAGAVALRDSQALTAWNVLATMFAVALLTARIPSMRRLTLVSLFWTMLLHVAFSIAGMVMLLGEDQKERTPDPARRTVPWGAAARGTLLALPPLLLFGALLTSADARFEYLVKEVLDIDFWNIVSHLLLIGALTWIGGGFLRGRFVANTIALPHGVRLGASVIGAVETTVLLGSLNLLFLAFIAVQFSYFFGGDTVVLQTPGLTYAGYARRGFFELVGVLCCALPLLLGTEWMVRKDRIPNVVLFRTLAGMMVLLLLTILASAVQRLWLYSSAYGLTESRVHAAAVLLWLALVLLWFAATVLRGRRDRFVFGSVLAGYAVLAGLNGINPDALIARVNLDRASEGMEIDVAFTLGLSADAVPAVLDGFHRVGREDARLFARRLLDRYPAAAPGDWRTWNTSRLRARQLVRAQVPLLEKVAETGAVPGSRSR
jgi:hypothetical protein